MATCERLRQNDPALVVLYLAYEGLEWGVGRAIGAVRGDPHHLEAGAVTEESRWCKRLVMFAS